MPPNDTTPPDPWRPFWAMCGVGFFVAFSFSLLRNPIMPRFADAFTGSTAMIGFAVGATAWSAVLLRFPAAMLSDRIGRKGLFAVSLILFAAVPFGYQLVHSTKALVGIRFIHGIAAAIFGPIAAALVVDLSGALVERRRRLFASIQTAGTLIAPLVAGVLLDRTARDPFEPASWEFKKLFLVAGAAGVVALVVALRILFGRTPVEPIEKPRTFGRYFQSLGRTLRDRRLFATRFAQAILPFASNALGVFLALFVTDVLEQKNWFAGLLIAVQLASQAAARPVAGFLVVRIGNLGLVLIGLVAASLPLVVVWMVEIPWLMIPFMAAFGFGMTLVISATTAMGGDPEPAATIRDAAEGSGPVVMGWIKDAFIRRGSLDRDAYLNTFAPLGLVFVVAAIGFALAFRGKPDVSRP